MDAWQQSRDIHGPTRLVLASIYSTWLCFTPKFRCRQPPTQELNYVPWLQEPALKIIFKNLSVRQGLDEILPKEANPVHISPSDVPWLSGVLFPVGDVYLFETERVTFYLFWLVTFRCISFQTMSSQNQKPSSAVCQLTHTHTRAHARAQAWWNSSRTVERKQKTISF